MKRMLELFSGTGRMAQAFADRGWKVATVDFEYPATINKDVRDLTVSDVLEALGGPPDVIWASPPCNGFTVAVVSRNWRDFGDGPVPISDTARQGIGLLRATIRLTGAFPRSVFFIENPRGMMRRMVELQEFDRRTVTYCQYGERRMKPTDIWTNCSSWESRTPCKNGDECHEAAPRGSKTGTQGVKGSYLRSALPFELCEEVAEACEKGEFQ